MASCSGRTHRQVFTCPIDDERILIYAPLRKIAFVANSAMISRVESHNADDEFTAYLRSEGFFDIAEEPVSEHDASACYDTLILFLSNQCSLRCRYCYASSGDFAPKFMTREIAFAAIDRAWNSFISSGGDTFTLGFHGGGEPTMHESLMLECISYTEDLVYRSGKSLVVSGAFNGCMSDRLRSFFIRHVDEMSISFDGIPRVHDMNRPFADGSPSSAEVEKTLYALDEAKKRYGVRMTVTASSVESLSDSVGYICRNHHPQRIQAEPVFLQGRASEQDMITESVDRFISRWVSAYRIARSHGVELFYSGARPDILTKRFCLASCRAFVVTADGDITTCFESYGREHPLSSRFIIGSFEDGRFVIDEEKRNACSSHTVDDNRHCESCFCKWHCAGDCAIKTLGENGYAETERCAVNRELTLFLLLEKIRESGGVMWKGK